MLKEIKCEKFTDRIKDKTVHFAPGLNCIVGADDAVNSIGKSSLLLIIDFCFGGTDYAENRADVIENVGDHTICFTFEFDSIQFHFSRNVSDSNFYFECDKFYSPIGEKKPIKELQRFLKERYFGSSIQSSFRNVINVFSRVYGKENYDVNKPLKTFGRDAKDENGIKVLLDLFGRLGELNEAISNIKTAKDGKKALDDAKKFGFIFSPIKTASEYDETLAAVQRLKDDLDSLVKDENAAKVVIDEKLSQKDIDLKSKQIVLMRRKRALSIQLNTFESMTGDNLMMSIDDKEKLLAEFPNYDVRPLLEINEFQRQLSKNVNEQINEQKEIVKKEIAEIDRQLKEVNDELLENDISPRISKAFLTAVLEKNEEIKKLESQIALQQNQLN